MRQRLYKDSNFNPHSPCGERPVCRSLFCCSVISIHTPHAGSDLWSFQCCQLFFCISIHTPHAGSDVQLDDILEFAKKFQSTLPMRGATSMQNLPAPYILISIHTPHAGSDVRRGGMDYGSYEISIHTPHAGSDYTGGKENA